MAVTTEFGFEIKGDPDYLNPLSDWNKLIKTVDNTLGGLARVYENTVISGFAPSYASDVITAGAGSGFAGSIRVKSTGPQNDSVIGTSDGTYRVYLAVADSALGTFTVNHAVSSPTDTIEIAEIVVVSQLITSLTDLRNYIPTVANHDHSGGAQGPLLNNNGIDAAANIAGSKLDLDDYITNTHISGTAAIAWSKIAADVVNADVDAAAAIAYSKLNLANGILNADVNTAAAIAKSKLALTDAILNADINSAAAIAYSKLALTGSVVYADLVNGAAKMIVKEEGATLDSNIQTIDFVGSGVTAVSDGLGKATVTISGGAGILNVSELADVEVVGAANRQVLRYDTTDSRWENEDPWITFTDTETFGLGADETITLVFTHAVQDWAFPPVPSCSWSGDDVEAFLDLGNEFSNTTFALKIRNTNCYNPTGTVTLNYTRKGPKA